MRDRERGLYEELLAEKDRQILILSDQVGWLRAQLGAPSWTKQTAANPTNQPVRYGEAPFVNEDEEDIQDMLERGIITKDQVPELLEAIGAANTEYTVH